MAIRVKLASQHVQLQAAAQRKRQQSPIGMRRKLQLETVRNSLVAFPSWAPHEVRPIRCPTGNFRDVGSHLTAGIAEPCDTEVADGCPDYFLCAMSMVLENLASSGRNRSFGNE